MMGQMSLEQDSGIKGASPGGGNLKIQPLGMGPTACKPRSMADLRLYPPFCGGLRRFWPPWQGDKIYYGKA